MDLEIGTNPSSTDDTIPPRFMAAVLDDPIAARKRWQLTKEWRVAQAVDGVLEEPQTHFDLCKKYYPHYLHKCDKSNQLVYIERPGRADFQSIWKSGVSLDDLARHYVFQTEVTWRILDTRDDARLLSIFDVEGGTLNDLAGNALSLFKKCSEVIQMHYPERSAKIIIINAPWWFQTGFTLVSPFIDPRTKKKIKVLGKDYTKALLKEIPAENLPLEYGGSDKCQSGLSPAELQIWEHVTRVNDSHGVATEDPETVYAWQRTTLFRSKKAQSATSVGSDSSQALAPPEELDSSHRGQSAPPENLQNQTSGGCGTDAQ